MDALLSSLRLKRSPDRKSLELKLAGVAERQRHPALNWIHIGSNPFACTVERYTSSAGYVVVRPTHPCGGQRVGMRAWPNGEAPVLHTGNGSPILSARTISMIGAVGKPRQPVHAGVVQLVERRNHAPNAVGSSPITGPGMRRRQRKHMSCLTCQRSSEEEQGTSNAKAAGSSPAVDTEVDGKLMRMWTTTRTTIADRTDTFDLRIVYAVVAHR